MTTYTVVREVDDRSVEHIEVEADTVAFKEGGVVSFWNTPDTITIDNEKGHELVTAFKNWSEVRRE